MVSKIKVGVVLFLCVALTASAFPNPALFMLMDIVDSLAKNGVEGESALFCHPADGNADWQLVLSEAIAYLAGWQQGDNPMAYAIRAAYLWQNGEQYHYDAEESVPLCWVLGPVAVEGEVPIEGEVPEGEGEPPSEGEGEPPVEGEMGEGEVPLEGEFPVEGELPMEGEYPMETILLPGNVPLELVRIPAGSFQMGSPDTERSRDSDEDPVHTVTIAYDFYMGKYEVTQQQWLAVMGSSPGGNTWDYGQGDSYPAYYVSWDDAQVFITALNTHITNTGQGPETVRLPSEAEWEYACRAGTTTRFYFGDSLSVDDYCEDDGTRSQYMWYCGNNNPNGSKPVGGKLENAFGLHDMSGNLWEWCQDWYHSSYTGAPADGSAWESPTGLYRVDRGGGWRDSAWYCRSASRNSVSPGFRFDHHGFRLAASPAVR